MNLQTKNTTLNILITYKKISNFDRKTKPSIPQSTLGCFTNDKTKLLYFLTTNTSFFYDAMYPAAIASHYTTDFIIVQIYEILLPVSEEKLWVKVGIW